MQYSSSSIIQSELDPDERLIWSGSPAQGIKFRGSDIFMIPFSLLWGGFAIFWEYSAIRGGAPLFFALWGVPFVIVGLHMIFGRFVIDAKIREKTFYGLTDERVLIVSGLFKKKIKSLSLRTLDDVSFSDHGGGTGVNYLWQFIAFWVAVR